MGFLSVKRRRTGTNRGPFEGVAGLSNACAINHLRQSARVRRLGGGLVKFCKVYFFIHIPSGMKIFAHSITAAF